MDNRIKAFFEEHHEDILNDIAKIVAVDSVRGEPQPCAPYGAGPRRALDVALEIAQQHGLEGEIRGDRVLVIELGQGEAELGILAHLDVVPPAGEWSVTQPYVMRKVEDKIYGRGVIDDKGPAMMSMWALICARELGMIRRKVQLILGSDEECGSGDIQWYLEHYRMPPKVFTPDGSFPVVNTEKGRAHYLITAPAFTGEGLRVTKLTGGSVANAVPAYCRVELFDGTAFDIAGRAAHGSLPQEGDNAVTRAIERLAGMEGEGFELFRTLNRVFPHGDVWGEAIGEACSDELSGALTVNLGVMEYDETSGLRAQVDCRVPVCGDGERIARSLRSALGGGFEVKVLSNSKPHHTPAESELVRGLLEIYQEYTGTKGEALSMGGGTYVHEIQGGVAFGAEFPGSDVHMHEPDERVSLEELFLGGEMYAAAVCRFCG